MQFINPNQKHIKTAWETHFRELKPVLDKRIEDCQIYFLKRFFKKNIVDVLKGKPEKLIQIQVGLFNEKPDFKTYLDEKRKTKTHNKKIRQEYSPFFEEIQRIIDYKTFITKTENLREYDAYQLAKNLNVNTCSYCNRLYTKTVTNQNKNGGGGAKLTRPTFDHWFPQSKNPILALSFYNLIPSCNVCNSSLKSSTDMTLKDHIHPYVDEEINFQFSYKLNSVNTPEFMITNYGDDANTKSKNTAEFFKLKEIYETHIDEIQDLLQIKKAYSVTYLKSMKTFFKGASALSNAEIYRLAFGTEIDETKFEKRPLSRMKRDLLIELGIIRK